MNDSQKMSFDDLFWKREFASFIKESNVYDRKISPNYTGLDALIESIELRKCLRLNTIYGISKFDHYYNISPL